MRTHLLQVFFHHLYHQLAWAYDLVAALVSLGQWQTWGRQSLDYVTGPNVLELGFGPGHVQAALAKQHFNTFGIDESPQMLARATQRLLRNGQKPRLARALAQALPFASGYFNTVLSTFPSEYIIASHTLAEVMRVLQPGGLLVVLPAAWPGWLLGWLFWLTGQSRPITHTLLAKVQTPFEAAGFDVSTRIVQKRGATLIFILARKPAPL